MIDFLFYWSHRLKHKINLLWKFHTIHHYSGTLSFLSRNHPLDLIPMKILSLVPMAVLSSSFKSLAITYLIYNLYQFFLHSNSNISLGPLNHILVSPKYHRIHHLVDSKYANKNFASFFSFYDLFFNTQLMPKRNTAYNKMQTGVHGLKHENFRSLKLIDLPRAFLQQVMLKIPKE
ncbi:MAG: sterol desaturase family protein [Oligoflexia bacterium]|nr:sterol desaturase family protein [Oligoflexia bacterium]